MVQNHGAAGPERLGDVAVFSFLSLSYLPGCGLVPRVRMGLKRRGEDASLLGLEMLPENLHQLGMFLGSLFGGCRQSVEHFVDESVDRAVLLHCADCVLRALPAAGINEDLQNPGFFVHHMAVQHILEITHRGDGEIGILFPQSDSYGLQTTLYVRVRSCQGGNEFLEPFPAAFRDHFLEDCAALRATCGLNLHLTPAPPTPVGLAHGLIAP